MQGLAKFVKDFVVANGGDAEPGPVDGSYRVMVSASLRDTLQLPEAIVTLVENNTDEDSKDCFSVGYGSSLLEKCVASAIRTGPTAAVQMPEPSTRISVGKIIKQQLTFPNAVFHVVQEQKGWCDYWLWTFKVTTQADDKLERVHHICISSNRVECPELPELLRINTANWNALDIRPSDDLGELLRVIYLIAVNRALRANDEKIGAFKEMVARHHRRDAERTRAYFEDLMQEMEDEITRRNLKGEAFQIRREKQEQLSREASTKLAALREKYRLRLSIAPLAVLLARLPVTHVELLVKRRKSERRITTTYNLLSRRFEPLACEACGAATVTPGFCDQKLHILCKPCLSKSGGRGMLNCPGCNGSLPPSSVDMVLKQQGIKKVE